MKLSKEILEAELPFWSYKMQDKKNRVINI
jgi:hypothetical protein